MSILSGVVALVDDDESSLRALGRGLAAYGLRVKVFASAEQYLAEVNAEISCAVIDIDLAGGLSGLDLGEAICAKGARATPIVFMSDSHDSRACRRATDLGRIEFLEKPFLVSRLIAAIVKLDGRDS